jgi:hypothetical protein
MHNPRVRRLLAACLLVVFATLATMDAVACPDGCQTSGSSSAADQCSNSGVCIFCTGGVVAVAPLVVPVPLVAVLTEPTFALTTPAFRPGHVPDRPPRIA